MQVESGAHHVGSSLMHTLLPLLENDMFRRKLDARYGVSPAVRQGQRRGAMQVTRRWVQLHANHRRTRQREKILSEEYQDAYTAR